MYLLWWESSNKDHPPLLFLDKTQPQAMSEKPVCQHTPVSRTLKGPWARFQLSICSAITSDWECWVAHDYSIQESTWHTVNTGSFSRDFSILLYVYRTQLHQIMKSGVRRLVNISYVFWKHDFNGYIVLFPNTIFSENVGNSIPDMVPIWLKKIEGQQSLEDKSTEFKN